MKDETTWTSPDETVQTLLTTRSGRELTVTLRCWRQILMRGTSPHPMYQHPFTLLQIRVTDVEGQPVWSPLWLIAIGSRRHQLTCLDIYQSYRQRFDLEHLWRFGKQRLLRLTIF